MINLQTCQSYMDCFQSSVLSPSLCGKIKATAFADKTSDLMKNIEKAITSDTSYWFPISLVGPDGVEGVYLVDVHVLYDNVAEGIPQVTTVDAVTNAEVIFDCDEVTDALASEIEVSRASGKILTLLSTSLPSISVASLIPVIKESIGDMVTSGGRAFMSIIASIAASVSDVSEFITSVLSLFTANDDDNVFKGTTIGTYTGTSGLGLWAAAIGENLANAMVYLVTNVKPALSRIGQIVAAGIVFAGLQGLIWQQKVKYWMDDLFDDPFIRLSDQNGDDPSSLNGFVHLGVVDEGFRTTLMEIGHDFSKPIAIPTLGATWYLWYDDDRQEVLIGFMRHLYTKYSATVLNQSFDRAEYDQIPTNNFSLNTISSNAITIYGDVSEANEFLYLSLRQSSYLIEKGLWMLTCLADDYTPPIYEGEDRFVFVPPASEVITRTVFLDDAVYAQTANAKQYAQRCIKKYLTAFYSTEASLCIHCEVAQPVSGYFMLQDDANLVLSASNTARDVFVGAVVIAALIAAGVGYAKLVKMKNQTSVMLTRAINDVDTPIEDIAKLRRKLNFLNAVTGASFGGALMNLLPSIREENSVNNTTLTDDFSEILKEMEQPTVDMAKKLDTLQLSITGIDTSNI